MFIHVPTFEEFMRGREFKNPEELQAMKDGWNAAIKSADLFMQDVESNDYEIVKALHVE